MTSPEGQRASHRLFIKRIGSGRSDALAAAVAGVLTVASPSVEAMQSSPGSFNDSRVERMVRETVTVRFTDEPGREVTYEYIDSRSSIFYTDAQLQMTREIPRNDGIQDEIIYLRTLGLNPVVPLNSNQTREERRLLALRDAAGQADSLVATGFPTVLRDVLVHDIEASRVLSVSEIRSRERYLVPGFVADGMTQGDGRGGVRPVDTNRQTIQMLLERSGHRFVSYSAEVVGTYLLTDAQGRAYEYTVFVIDECGNMAFSRREVRMVQQPAPESRREAQESEGASCLTVELDNRELISRGARPIEAIGGVLRIARRDGASLSQEEEEALRTCAARTVAAAGNVFDLCADCVSAQTADIAREVLHAPETGLVATERINPRQYQAQIFVPLRLRGRETFSGGIVRFFTPENNVAGEDRRAYHHPIWCQDIELNGRRYRLELQSEENAHLLREAATNEQGIRINMAHGEFVWQEVLDDEGNRLSRHRYNLRGGEMVRAPRTSGRRQ